MSEVRAFCAMLDDRGAVFVTGPDATAFLDNLVTNSLDGLEESAARFAALLSPQGKILFEFFVVRAGEGYWLDVRRDKAGELVKRLAVYRLRAKVEIRDCSNDSAIAAIWWLPLGSQPTSFTYEAEVRAAFADPRDNRLGLRLIVRPAGDALPVRHLSGASIAGPANYRAALVEAGIGEGGIDYPLGDTFPHEANYDLVGGVSFSKGCYVGQEVVSRMQNKTVVRKRVVRIKGAGLSPGGDVKVGEAAIGTVGSVDGPHALALVRLDRVVEAIDKAQEITVDGKVVVVDPAAIERYKLSVINKPVVDL